MALLLLLFMAAAIFTFYFLPTIIAFSRRVPNSVSVLVINIFLGWTLIGWFVALAMAARSIPEGR
ncbi:MAG: superinfection immunity protein [Acidimicrobiaceae bacterium]|nr:superinfection immunity protein [Acidimicrobiaceae bacterium]